MPTRMLVFYGFKSNAGFYAMMLALPLRIFYQCM